MAIGGLLHSYVGALSWTVPWFLFVMLLITYCRVDMRQIRPNRMIWILLAVQIAGALALWLVLREFSPILAIGVFICVFSPTATVAPIITGLLGGNLSLLVTYSFASNCVVALLAPFVFTMLNAADPASAGGTIDILGSIGNIAMKVMPLLIVPLVLAFLMKRFTPRLHRVLRDNMVVTFWLWLAIMIVVMGQAVDYLLTSSTVSGSLLLYLAVGAAIVCAAQFYVGRIVGRKYGEAVAGAQGLGQKNTVLAIWMTLTFFNPCASVAPSTYIVWQNLINSWQLARHKNSKA